MLWPQHGTAIATAAAGTRQASAYLDQASQNGNGVIANAVRLGGFESLTHPKHEPVHGVPPVSALLRHFFGLAHLPDQTNLLSDALLWLA